MRNIWFPKGVAEYMTKKRFEELGLTEAAIGARDRNFGSKIVVAEDKGAARLEGWKEEKKKLSVGVSIPSFAYPLVCFFPFTHTLVQSFARIGYVVKPRNEKKNKA
jgi:hypothetical protein